MAQVQCPNDGGYKVSTEIVYLDPKTGRELYDPSGCIWLFFVGTVGIILALGGVVVALIEDHEVTFENIFATIVCLIFCALAAITGLIHYARESSYYKKVNKIIKYKHECLLCGYKWERREDEPLPEVHVRPDLIAKGAQRLEEEATERRRQEEAAAHAFLEQQRRKK
jgi:hypothetical protein